MLVHQNFAFISEGIVQCITVCDSYTEGNRLAKAIYGSDAVAVDCTQWGCMVGDLYRDNVFYRVVGDEEQPVQNFPTEEQEIKILKVENEELLEAAVESDYRLSAMELSM